MITENLSTLKIHKLTQEQYERELEAGRIDPSALYLTPDNGDIDIYVQNDEPVDAEEGSLWIDMDAEGSNGESKIYVDDSLSISGQAADAKAVGDALADKTNKQKYGKLVVMGDSLGEGANNDNYSFVDILSESGVFESVVKACKSGATVGPYQVGSSASGYDLNAQIERYASDVADADIIICEYGANDVGSLLAGNVEMGTVDDASTATTICGYVKKAIARIYELNPDAAIHWVCPFPREFQELKAIYPDNMDYVDGALLFDACALRMAQNCGCFILVPFCLNTNLLSSDGMHPNTEGHKAYATAILNGLYKEQHLLYTERLLTVGGDTDTLSNLTVDGTFANVLKLLKANVPVKLVITSTQYGGTTMLGNLNMFNPYMMGFSCPFSYTGTDASMAYIMWGVDDSVTASVVNLVANVPNAEGVSF